MPPQKKPENQPLNALGEFRVGGIARPTPSSNSNPRPRGQRQKGDVANKVNQTINKRYPCKYGIEEKICYRCKPYPNTGAVGKQLRGLDKQLYNAVKGTENEISMAEARRRASAQVRGASNKNSPPHNKTKREIYDSLPDRVRDKIRAYNETKKKQGGNGVVIDKRTKKAKAVLKKMGLAATTSPVNKDAPMQISYDDDFDDEPAFNAVEEDDNELTDLFSKKSSLNSQEQKQVLSESIDLLQNKYEKKFAQQELIASSSSDAKEIAAFIRKYKHLDKIPLMPLSNEVRDTLKNISQILRSRSNNSSITELVDALPPINDTLKKYFTDIGNFLERDPYSTNAPQPRQPPSRSVGITFRTPLVQESVRTQPPSIPTPRNVPETQARVSTPRTPKMTRGRKRLLEQQIESDAQMAKRLAKEWGAVAGRTRSKK